VVEKLSLKIATTVIFMQKQY